MVLFRRNSVRARRAGFLLGALVAFSLTPSRARAEANALSSTTPAPSTSGTSTSPMPEEEDEVRGVRRTGWWGGWATLGYMLSSVAAGPSVFARIDANPFSDVLVSGRARYIPTFTSTVFIDTDAQVGYLFSREFEGSGYESSMRKVGEDSVYDYYKVDWTEATIRTEWAAAGGVRYFHVGNANPINDVILLAGLERLRANSQNNRYLTSLRVFFNPAATNFGGALAWAYASPKLGRLIFGLEAGWLPLSDKGTLYITADIGVSFGN